MPEQTVRPERTTKRKTPTPRKPRDITDLERLVRRTEEQHAKAAAEIERLTAENEVRARRLAALKAALAGEVA